MIARSTTERLSGQLRDRGADVTLLPHAGGHQIDPAQLPHIREVLKGADLD